MQTPNLPSDGQTVRNQFASGLPTTRPERVVFGIPHHLPGKCILLVIETNISSLCMKRTVTSTLLVSTLMGLSGYAALFVAPDERTMHAAQRIFYFHLL